MQTSLAIRCVTSGDVALIERFITDIANFHGDAYVNNLTAIMRDLFEPTSSPRAHDGEDDNQPLAFAVCYTEFALHLRLFYIVETHRRKGAAKQMLAHRDRRALDERESAFTVSANLQNEPRNRSR